MSKEEGGHRWSVAPVETALAAVVSGAITGTLLFVLWPPTAVYWRSAAEIVGETPTLVGIVVLATGAGVWVARTSGFGLVPIALGTSAAYTMAMLGIEVWLAPASPAHWVWYGLLAGALLCGALLWWIARQLAS